MKFFLALLLLIPLHLGAEITIPPLRSPVMDQAELLAPQEEKTLATIAYEIYAHKGPQITVLTVPNLQGYPIEEFSIRVAEKWQLGMKKQGNGLLIIISKENRRVRIEVGEGIEGEITDFESNQYITQVLTPAFKAGRFFDGLQVVMIDIGKKFDVPLEGSAGIVRRARPMRPQRTPFDNALPLFLGILVVGHLLLRRKPVARGLFSGAGMAGVGFFMLPGIGLGIILLFFFGFIFGLAGISNILYGLASSRGGRYGGGGFGGGGFGGGGGWSGGGGGFSGGGSSGSW